VASLMFPDNTVLINFAIINRMDLLERLANGNGQWCATVSGECAESARYPGLAALSAAEKIFGEALYPNPAEHQDVQVLRNQLASPGDPPSKHLGEAETVAIITRRRLSCFLLLTIATRPASPRGTASPSPVPGACCKLLTGKSGSMPTRSGDTYRPLRLTIEERHQAYGIAQPSISGSQCEAFG
jgi:hypothetical protein